MGDEHSLAARQLRQDKVEAVVVCLLHSYINPAHEREVAAIVRQEVPEAFLSVSSDVCPEYREYLRASTTAVNAAVMRCSEGTVKSTLSDARNRLRKLLEGRDGPA